MNRASLSGLVKDLFSRRGREAAAAKRRRRSPGDAGAPERLEERRLLAFDLVAAYAQSDAPFYVIGQTAQTLTETPQQITLRFSPGARIDPSTIAGNILVQRSGAAGDAFGPGGVKADVTVAPGSITVDDLPNENQVIIRFAETPVDDTYRLTIKDGLKTVALPGLPAESFSRGGAPTHSFDFRVDLGAFVVSVVPQPLVRQPSGSLTQDRGIIHVYFNTEDPLQVASAQNSDFYRLFAVDPKTNNTIGGPLAPTSVVYDSANGRVTLFFPQLVSAEGLHAEGLHRLEIGGRPAPNPVVRPSTGDDNSSFTTAQNLGSLTGNGIVVTGSIDPRPTVPTPVGPLGFPSQPGTLDSPGHRDTPADSGEHGAPKYLEVDPATGLAVVYYNFGSIIGSDGQGNTLYNVITEAQKQRTREIFELFSLSAGIRFVESDFLGMLVATGDLRAFNKSIEGTSGVAGLGGSSGALMNSSIDWGNSEYGGAWFRVAMHEIGHALGLEHSYDLNSIMGAASTGEPIFPGNYDIEHLRQLYPDNGSDIDVYRFDLAEPGRFSAETVAGRPGRPADSYLDSVISLYRERTVNGKTVRELVARNDDYYGRDSFVGLNLEAGRYFIAVTSTGNTAFDPNVSDSGANGRTEGDYRLEMRFTPAAASANTIVDVTGQPLDGDRDGVPGGRFSFWFNTARSGNTIFVDKANPLSGAGDGSLANPYKTIQAAIAAVVPGSTKIIRIAGTAAAAYQIGRNLSGVPLADGVAFNVPAGVTAMIDGGAVFKLRAANIDVGSSSRLVSRAGAAIQVLGVPATGTFAGNRVTFTSWHDDSIGGDSDNVGPALQGGQWGGIVLRQDSDIVSKQAFVNSISGADIRYGGGQVEVDSQLESFAPIQLESTRPTVIFNTITDSANAAIAATPNSFDESGDRFGPEFRGNRLSEVRNDGVGNAPLLHQNSINGLFVKIKTEFGSPLDRLDVPARFKSSDIVYVIQENLVITGGAGGYADSVTRIGDIVAGSHIVKGLSTTADLLVGMEVVISDPDNPDNPALHSATIVSIDGPTEVTLSSPAPVTRRFATVQFQKSIVDVQGSLTFGSPLLTNLATTAGIRVGMLAIAQRYDPVTEEVINVLPEGTRVVAIDSITQSVTLPSAAVETYVGRILFVDPVAGFVRPSGRLTIDPGVVVKLQGSRIELERGVAQLVAEGLPGKSVIFTSLGDNRYGAGGTFDTNGSVPDKFDRFGRPIDANGGIIAAPTRGDWGGIVVNAGSRASIDRAYLAFGGGQTPIEGDFDNFNVLELHQGDLRLANSRLEHNAAGTARTLRTGRGDNDAATIFVRGSQPIIVGNDFRSNSGAVVSIDANSLSDERQGDVGRTSGALDRYSRYDDNFGPLVRSNTLSYRPGSPATAGMVVRGGEITVESVWDDTDIVHVLQDEIFVMNFHTATGIRLLSRPDASLVVKLFGENAGFTASGANLDIDDRIGGTVQVVGQPGYPVILSSLRDDSVGASLDPLGRIVTDVNVDGTATSATAGDWRSLKFLPLSNDRNVSIRIEREQAYTAGTDANGTPESAESLGVLAPNFATSKNTWESAQEKSGDENRRLGFEVHGNVALDSSGDVDVYSFLGYVGSEVWIDVDKTSPSLDAMVELLDANGNVLARSIDSIAEGGVVQREAVTRESTPIVLLAGVVLDSATITVPSIDGLSVGMLAQGDAFPAGTVITAIDPMTLTLTLSNPSSVNGLDAQLSFAPVSAANVTYQFAPTGLVPDQFSILPGTLSGVIYHNILIPGTTVRVPKAIQTFAVDRNGTVTFQNILGRNRMGEVKGVLRLEAPLTGEPGQHAAFGAFDPATGRLTLSYRNGEHPVDPESTTVVVRYSYDTPHLKNVTGIGESLGKESWRGGDFYSLNPRDPGMRVILPGTQQGAQTQYFIRVRSQPRYEPETTATDNGAVTATTAAAYRADVSNAGNVTAGATSGRYELRVRLRQRDEKPGSTVRYADIRYPMVGVDVLGLPANSPLVADSTEHAADDNNAFDAAQYLGNLLQSNRGALGVSGTINDEADVDWFSFALNYEQIQYIKGVNDPALFWATVLDIDYADGFRGDLTISLFDENGQLIYVGRDSDITDDQPGPLQGNDFDDLSRGSVGKLDPFIGSINLPAGPPTGKGGGDTGEPVMPPDPNAQLRYYVAISSNERLPEQLNAQFFSGAANPFIRLEPIATVDRIASDRIAHYFVQAPGVGTRERLINTSVFDHGNTASGHPLDKHVTPFTLADVTLFVSTGSSLITVDAMRGGIETTIEANYGPATTLGDIVMRSDGRLYGYRGVVNNTTTAGELVELSAGTGVATAYGRDNIKDPIQRTQTDLAPAGGSDELRTVFELEGDSLKPPQDFPITGRLRFQRVVETTAIVNGVPVPQTVTLTGLWDFSVLPAAINGIAALAFTPQATPPGLDNSPFRGELDLATGELSIEWQFPVQDDATILLRTVTYTTTFNDIATDQVDAVAWQRVDVGVYENLVYSVWDPASQSSKLFLANPQTGSAELAEEENWGIQGTLSVGGVRTTGMAWLGDTLYAVGADGTFFSITGVNDGDFEITTNPIAELGFPFQGLTVGPQNLEGGRYAEFLFAIDTAGNLYCLDATGELQEVFDSDNDAVVDATSINVGRGGVTGLAFSPLDVNLWHVTRRRGGDPGGSYTGDANDQASMYFGFEEYQPANPTYGSLGDGYEAPNPLGQFGVVSPTWQADLSSNPAIFNTYNLPGGAHGSLTTNPFSLEGYSSTDKPTLYFDYWLQTQNAASKTDGMRDSARVLASIDGGISWTLLATNNAVRSAIDLTDAELPHFLSVSSRMSTLGNQRVQELYDTSNWRQARVDLGDFAGRKDIRLRFDFHTAGEFDQVVRTIVTTAPTSQVYVPPVGPPPVGGQLQTQLVFEGLTEPVLAGMGVVGDDIPPGTTVSAVMLSTDPVTRAKVTTVTLSSFVATALPAGREIVFTKLLNNIAGLANQTGNFNSSERGQNNQFEGFYIDDIVIGFAERGEQVTNAAGGSTGFFDVGTPAPTSTIPGQILNGPYQLEIRRGSELGSVQLIDKQKTVIPETYDTNDRLIMERSTTVTGDNATPATHGAYGVSLGDRNVTREQGQFIVENNIVLNARDFGIRIDAGDRDPLSNATHPGGVRNLPTLNTQRLVPGAVVSNNIVARAGNAGILFSGDANVGNTPDAAVPFGRIIHNTIYGGPTPQGIGVQVTDNAGPTLLNNLFVNLKTGVAVDGSSAGFTVVGTSAYWNAAGAAGVVESDAIALTGNPFVNAESNNFYLVAGTRAIDSSLNSLQDRNSFVQVNSPVGISPSPIVTPDRDLYGQLRSDDPGVTNMTGLGGNVFKDRGAIDRVDFTQPFARIEVPQDNGSDDLELAADLVRVRGAAAGGLTSFVLHLQDVGVGIDPATITSAAFVLSRNGTPLQPGVDYVFDYNPLTQRVTFRSPAVFSLGSYGIRIAQEVVSGVSRNVIKDLAGNPLRPNRGDGTTVFTIEMAEAPGMPTGVVGSTGDGRVSLSWTAPANTGSSAITDYMIEYSSNGGSTWIPFSDATSPATTAVVDGLTNRTAYIFRVAAVNGIGQGDFSVPSAPVTPEALPPSPPVNVIGAPGDRLVSLAWTAPSSDGGQPITDYEIQFSSNGGMNWTTFPDSNSTAISTTVTGLSNGTAYVFRVRARNVNGPGAYSLSSAPVTPRVLASAPSLAGSRGDGSVTLTWAPPFDGGSPITGYVIERTVNGVVTTQPVGIVPTTATLSGLGNGTPHTFRVAAVTAAGRGAWSNQVSLTPLAAPGAPTGLAAEVGNGSVTLSWTPPASTGGAPITGYTVRYTLNGSSVTVDVGPATSTVIPGLANGTTYQLSFTVQARNEAGAGPQSAAFATTVVPQVPAAAPTRLTARASLDTVSLAWTAPRGAARGSIAGYDIQASTDGGRNWFNAGSSAVTRTTVKVSALGTPHVFRVRARTTAGVSTTQLGGDWSANSIAVTPFDPRAVPAAPTNLTMSQSGRTATLSWMPPPPNAGGPATSYVVQYKLRTSAVWRTVRSAPGNSATVTNLAAGSSYDFRVQARNRAGLGAFASASITMDGSASVPRVSRPVVGQRFTIAPRARA